MRAAAHDLAALHYAMLLAVVGRLDDAAAQVADGTEQARRERNAMALDMWATMDGCVHLAAGRLSAARAATESLAPPQQTGVSEQDMVRTAILAEVAARTDDRTLLQQTVNDARDAYPTGSSVVRRGAAHVLALAAWQRDDVHDAMRWLGDITLFGSPIWPQVLDQVILGARVASAAGDAGLRARVLQAMDLLERERPAIPLFTGVAGYARGILERDAQALMAAADVLHSSSRPLLYAAAAEDAGAELAHTDRRGEAVDQLNAAFDTYLHHEALADARRVGRELRRFGVQRRIVSQPRAKTGWDSLTDSELRVVNLIAHGRDQPRRRHAAAPFPPYGEKPRPQCVRQAGHQLPHPARRSSCAGLIDQPVKYRVRLIPSPGGVGEISTANASPTACQAFVRRYMFRKYMGDLDARAETPPGVPARAPKAVTLSQVSRGCTRR